MTVTVYQTPTGPEHIYKDITNQIGEYSGAVPGDVSIERPVIEIQAQIVHGNYVYIPDFGRYYWITSKNVIRQDLTFLTLETDPLMSFADKILQCRCICSQRVSREPLDRYIVNSGYKTRIYHIMGSMDDPTISAEDRALPFDNNHVIVGIYG